MEKYLDIISAQLKEAFESKGYDGTRVAASVSNRPDLCEFQCNSAMALAKSAGKAPIMIAEEVAGQLKENPWFSEVSAVKPGFINLKVSGTQLAGYVDGMNHADKFGLENASPAKKIIIDYGGANVAKPLHIGHLRSAIIGESLKRICRYLGHEAIGDVHLGDWGLQMGQIIAELQERQPDLPYFDQAFDGSYPEEPPFTISELEEIYPCASGKCKTDPAFAQKAHEATHRLQNGDPGYRAIWNHILNVSIADLKKNYDALDVHFELWKKESDAQPYIPAMLEDMKGRGILKESEGALVVEIGQEDDKKELPPCIVVKSDGATLYSTTDLATLVERMQLFGPDKVIYVVDKRQELHFIQVFRTSRKAGIVPDQVELEFLGFGTMNGKDGQPYKTRSGGVMRLETLIGEINDAVLERMKENREFDQAEAQKTARIIGLAALKYADLSNQATKDYIFDLSRFTSFEGNTGPYILYTIVRIRSILNRYGKQPSGHIRFTGNEPEKQILIELSRFSDVIGSACKELAPHKICSYLYDLANAFNVFYHEVRILTEEDEEKKDSYLSLLDLTARILEQCISLLGFAAPERM
ncbi:MAG: arginine--tRNA ligase [Parasporobacterium sp.]|nr:arginine--tRNA ligase [Parasporobacterium sp.]